MKLSDSMVIPSQHCRGPSSCRTPAPRTAAPVRRQRAPRRPAAGGITQDEADLPGRGNKTLRDLLAFESDADADGAAATGRSSSAGADLANSLGLASEQRRRGGGGVAAPPRPRTPEQQQQQQQRPIAGPRGQPMPAPMHTAPPSAAGGGGGSSSSSSSSTQEGTSSTRTVLQSALDLMQRSGAAIAEPIEEPPQQQQTRDSGGSSARDRDLRSYGRGAAGGATSAGTDDGRAPSAPSWAASLLGSEDFSLPSGSSAAFSGPALQRAPVAAPARSGALAWADDPSLPPLRLPPASIGLLRQSELDAARAAAAVLPPLQSVLELTTAYRPPERTGAPVAAPAPDAAGAVEGEAGVDGASTAAATVGRALPDGSGKLADGTWWEKRSGVEYGENGYWKRWQLLRGGDAAGTVEWEETWWEASDYTGLKELGAHKAGRDANGGAWRETWSERMAYTSNDLDCEVERTAHKWASQADGDEWEEKWGERYTSDGAASKHADKWGKAGPNVWHERWGEDYAAGSDGCVKWTDRWAERLLPGGGREQWGDKWHEGFGDGRGEKNGEVWSVGAGGDRYQRWWGEQHLGGGQVRRHGHSTSGESWDEVISMDTYYNPVPHFGFSHALAHSPQLRNVPLRPKDFDGPNPFGPGLDAL